jgi:hypothetical protein
MKLLLLPFRILLIIALLALGIVLFTIWWPLAVFQEIWRDFRDESR